MVFLISKFRYFVKPGIPLKLYCLEINACEPGWSSALVSAYHQFCVKSNVFVENKWF